MRWGIYRVKSDGSEEYVNQKDQGMVRILAKIIYEECDNSGSGIYRIYIASKDEQTLILR